MPGRRKIVPDKTIYSSWCIQRHSTAGRAPKRKAQNNRILSTPNYKKNQGKWKPHPFLSFFLSDCLSVHSSVYINIYFILSVCPCLLLPSLYLYVSLFIYLSICLLSFLAMELMHVRIIINIVMTVSLLVLLLLSLLLLLLLLLSLFFIIIIDSFCQI